MDVKIAERDKVKVADADDIFRIMRRILLREEKIDQGKEHFWILGLEGSNRLLFIELVSIGGNTKVSVNPREVFQVAVQKGAVRAVLVHNHPDGTLMPSDEDEKLTDRLIQAGRLLGIEVIEHLIITTETFFSFTLHGLMEKLRHSTRYMLPYELDEKIQEALRQGMERGVRKGIREGDAKVLKLARALIDDGADIERISAILGLSEDDIRLLEVGGEVD